MALWIALFFLAVIGALAVNLIREKKSPQREQFPQDTPLNTPPSPITAHLPEKFIVFDLETTGLNPSRHEIIEIGAIKIVRDAAAHDTFTALVKPERGLNAGATRVNGITREMLDADGEPLASALKDFLEFIEDLPIVAYNADFDIQFLRQAADQQAASFTNQYSCALAMARIAWPGRDSYALSSFPAGLGVPGTPHRALRDCMQTVYVFTAAGHIITQAGGSLPWQRCAAAAPKSDDPTLLHQKEWQHFQSTLRPKKTTDQNGQPDAHLNSRARAQRSTQELLGLLKGILADGIVQPQEIESLGRWLVANIEPDPQWPVDVICDEVSKALISGPLDSPHCERLKALFASVTGNPSSPYSPNAATSLPLTEPAPDVQFPSRIFVLTGKFRYGARETCTAAIVARGGICVPNITQKVDYLVVGNTGSRDWRFTSFGTKIEAAVERNRNAGQVKIISEEHWSKFL